ncbi:MAG: hypothetical protein R2710_05305 [Acidimicrobiales bacterium]
MDEGDGEDPDDETDDESETPTAPTVLIELEAKTAGADEGIADLEALGIIEEISTFTTKHDCCQGRHQHHNMADIRAAPSSLRARASTSTGSLASGRPSEV